VGGVEEGRVKSLDGILVAVALRYVTLVGRVVRMGDKELVGSPVLKLEMMPPKRKQRSSL